MAWGPGACSKVPGVPGRVQGPEAPGFLWFKTQNASLQIFSFIFQTSVAAKSVDMLIYDMR